MIDPRELIIAILLQVSFEVERSSTWTRADHIDWYGTPRQQTTSYLLWVEEITDSTQRKIAAL